MTLQLAWFLLFIYFFSGYMFYRKLIMEVAEEPDYKEHPVLFIVAMIIFLMIWIFPAALDLKQRVFKEQNNER